MGGRAHFGGKPKVPGRFFGQSTQGVRLGVFAGGGGNKGGLCCGFPSTLKNKYNRASLPHSDAATCFLESPRPPRHSTRGQNFFCSPLSMVSRHVRHRPELDPHDCQLLNAHDASWRHPLASIRLRFVFPF